MKNRLFNSRAILVSSLLAVVFSGLSACSSNAGNSALIGSLAGAAIGKSTANHHDSRAAIGAIVGAAAGAVVGSQRDLQRPRYQQPRYQSYQQPRRYTRSRYQPQTIRYQSHQTCRPTNRGYRNNRNYRSYNNYNNYGHYYRP